MGSSASTSTTTMTINAAANATTNAVAAVPTTVSTTATDTNNYIKSCFTKLLNSNNSKDKFLFLIIILFVFLLLFRLGLYILGWIYMPSSTQKIVSGMVDGRHLIVVPQDPDTKGAKTIMRSENATDGIEFTWSCWIYIDDMTYNSGKYKCVFYKGNDFASTIVNTESEENGENGNNGDGDEDEGGKNHTAGLGLNFPNNAPGVYIAPNTNKLVIFMNTFNVINENIVVNDIPLNKWFNVIIRCQNKLLDVYINGSIAKSHKLHGVPKQNYGNVYVASNGGFSGYISNLYYYPYALGTLEISSIIDNGPDTTMKSSSDIAKSSKDADYLSLRWYMSGGSGSDGNNINK